MTPWSSRQLEALKRGSAQRVTQMDIFCQGREVQFNTFALKIKPIRDCGKPQSVPRGNRLYVPFNTYKDSVFCGKVFACRSYEAREERRTLQARGGMIIRG
jgi:hypothetical protein